MMKLKRKQWTIYEGIQLDEFSIKRKTALSQRWKNRKGLRDRRSNP